MRGVEAKGPEREVAKALEAALYVNEVSGWRRPLVRGLGGVVRGWQRLLEFSGLEAMQRLFLPDAPGCVVLLWHNRLFPLIGAFNRLERHGRQVYGLVSASRDGALLSAFLGSLGVATIRGSSSRRGGVAAREVVRVLRAGHHVVITVDGPRGPLYAVQPGAVFVSQMSHAPIVQVTAEVEAARVLSSWDKFILPLPGTRVRMGVRRYALPTEGGADRDALRADLQAFMLAGTADCHRIIV